MPDEPEVLGLLALLLLTEARRPARTAADGSLVRLADQDRSRWDRALITEGQDLVRACLRRNQPGPYQLQAAISAVHADAPAAADTDWRQILALYDQLAAITPTPVVALNRCVAVAEVHGPGAPSACSTGWTWTTTTCSTRPAPTCSAASAARQARRGLRRGHRARGQRRRAVVPHPPARRAGPARRQLAPRLGQRAHVEVLDDRGRNSGLLGKFVGSGLSLAAAKPLRRPTTRLAYIRRSLARWRPPHGLAQVAIPCLTALLLASAGRGGRSRRAGLGHRPVHPKVLRAVAASSNIAIHTVPAGTGARPGVNMTSAVVYRRQGVAAIDGRADISPGVASGKLLLVRVEHLDSQP